MIPAQGQQPADIRFRKGTSEIHYDLLSSGEKEVLNMRDAMAAVVGVA